MRCPIQFPLIIALLTVLPSFLVPAGSGQTGPQAFRSESPLAAPLLRTPANNSYLDEGRPQYHWIYPGTTEENVSFCIQIDDGPDFDSPMVDTLLSPGAMALDPAGYLGWDGTYFWHVQARNSTGARSAWSETWCVHYDWSAPYLQLPPPLGYVTSRNIFIEVVAYDVGSGLSDMRYSFDKQNWSAWEPYSAKLNVTLGDKDGKWRIYIQVRDKMNHTSSPMAISATLDRIAPIGTVSINNGTDCTNQSVVSLGFWANDTSNVTNMTVSDEPDFKTATWRPFNSSLQWPLSSGDGWKTVYVKYRDRAKLESVVESASILLDTTSPVASFRINGGSRYANSTQVLLDIAADDPEPASGIDEMAFGRDGLTWGPWEKFCSTRVFDLSPGDGPKTIYLITKDRAANIGSPSAAEIILDTTPPLSTFPSLGSETSDINFTVAWAGTDLLSAIRSLDVQYSVDGGPWIEWLAGVNQTRAVFHGTDGSAYFFRARAQDEAGNLGEFAQTGPEPLMVRVPLPLVTVQWPVQSEVISGEFTVAGTAEHPKGGLSIGRVDIRIDNGTFQPANGTLSWNFRLDSTMLDDGAHTISACSFDGARYSETCTVGFLVRNHSGNTPSTGPSVLTLLAPAMIIMLVALIVLALWHVRR